MVDTIPVEVLSPGPSLMQATRPPPTLSGLPPVKFNLGRSKDYYQLSIKTQSESLGGLCKITWWATAWHSPSLWGGQGSVPLLRLARIGGVGILLLLNLGVDIISAVIVLMINNLYFLWNLGQHQQKDKWQNIAGQFPLAPAIDHNYDYNHDDDRIK